jgi:hypothetical protein
MIIIEFTGQFYFQNDVCNCQKAFAKLGIRVFFEKKLRIFQAFYSFETSQRSLKRFQK